MVDALKKALILILLVALAVRVTWELLRPAIPMLMVLAAIVFVCGLLFKRSS